MRSDLNAMPFYLDTEMDIFTWILGALNPADVGTKLKSPLTESIILPLAMGTFQIVFTQCKLSQLGKSFG